MGHRDPNRYAGLLNDAELYIGKAYANALDMLVREAEDHADIAAFSGHVFPRITAVQGLARCIAQAVRNIDKGYTDDQFLWAAANAGALFNAGFDDDLPRFHFQSTAWMTFIARFDIFALDAESCVGLDTYRLNMGLGLFPEPTDFSLDIDDSALFMGAHPLRSIYVGVLRL